MFFHFDYLLDNGIYQTHPMYPIVQRLHFRQVILFFLVLGWRPFIFSKLKYQLQNCQNILAKDHSLLHIFHKFNKTLKMHLLKHRSLFILCDREK